jgi:hypothetical protein
MYNNGNSSKNVTGASVVDGTLENADYPDNGLSGDKIDGGIISNFQSTGIDDRSPTGKVLTLSDTGTTTVGTLTCDGVSATDGIHIKNPLSGSYYQANIQFSRDGTAGGAKIETVRSSAGGVGMAVSVTASNTAEVNGTYTESVRFPKSGGITFNGDTAAANALDDYEEGTFTSAYAGSTTNFTSITYDPYVFGGSYVKIGRIVSFSLSLRTDAVTVGSAAGNIIITGMPFTSAASDAGTDGYHSFSVSTSTGFATNNPIGCAMAANKTELTLNYKATSNGATAPLTVAEMATGADSNVVRISGSYVTA